MADGFSVDIEALKAAGLSVAELMAILGEHRVVDVDCAANAVGAPSLAAALRGFCDRWQVGMDVLTADGHQLAQHLIDAAGTYLEVEHQVMALLGGGPPRLPDSPAPAMPAPPKVRSFTTTNDAPAEAGELGQTSDPRVLVPGDPAALCASADSLARLSSLVEETGTSLQRLDSGGWTGEAGDAFEAYFDGEPCRWIRAGEAFCASAKALRVYSSELEWARRQAAEAAALWKRGEQATSTAEAGIQVAGVGAHDQQPRDDPGAEDRQQARFLLHHAREQLDGGRDQAEAVLRREQEPAPQERSLLKQLGTDLADAAESAVNALRDGPANVVRSFGEGLGDTLHGVVDAVGDAAKTMPTLSGVVGGGVLDAIGQHDQAEHWRNAQFEDAQRCNAVVDGAGLRAKELVTDGSDAAGDWIAGSDDDHGHYVLIDPHRYPETSLHIMQAQEGHSWDGNAQRPYWDPKPADLTIDRDGADGRRADALANVPRKPGTDRDEYPPAMFEEGGQDASVKYIAPGDNRGAGKSMDMQIRGQGLHGGEHVRIVVG